MNLKLSALFLFLFVGSIAFAQSNTVQELKEEEKVYTEYHLYPSTLRMINLSRDPAFDKLVRPIRRLSILSMNTNKYTGEDLQLTAGQLMQQEAYESYAEISGPDMNVFVLGREEKDLTCVLAEMDSVIYIAEVQGKIDLLQLSEIYSAVMQNDTSATVGIIDVFQLLNDDDDRQRRREEWEKKGRENEEKEKRDAQMKKDSLAAIETTEVIEQ